MRKRVIALSGVVLMAASLPWMLTWWRARTADGEPATRADVIIVLGGDPWGQRRREALRLCRRLGISRLLISHSDLPPLVVPRSIYLENIDMPLESTAAEATYYVRRLEHEKMRTAIVVTSPAHCYRTSLLFRRAVGSRDLHITVRPSWGDTPDGKLIFFEGAKLMLAGLHLDVPLHGETRGRLKATLQNLME